MSSSQVQQAMDFFGGAEIEVGDTVEAFGKYRAVIRAKFDHATGRVPALAVNAENGTEMIPFLDECRLLEKSR